MHSSPFVVLEISMTICTQDGHCLGGYMSQGIYGVPNVWQLMHGEDRVLLVQSDDDNELKIHYLIILIISNQFASFYVSVIFLFIFYLNVYYVQSNHTLETIGLSCMLQPMKMGNMWQLLGDKALFSTISRIKDGEFLGILIKNEKFSIGLVWLGRIIVLYNYREATKMRVVLFHCYSLFLILGQSRPISVYVVNIM
ncbi:unnamed protein product [Sphagnum troendelagicum]|uniref:Uncharacterized protein n=1 Tax=Sphagnum troendelagicum TaxID=128251 RepID=A0ABP0TNA2_9BRYO